MASDQFVIDRVHLHTPRLRRSLRRVGGAARRRGGRGRIGVEPVWTDERRNDKARRALAESKSVMFRTIKRRGLQEAVSNNG